MKSSFLSATLIGAAFAAPAFNCFPSLSSALSQAVGQLSGVPEDVLAGRAALLNKLQLVGRALGQVETATDGCVLDVEDELTTATDYAALQPAFATAGTAMIANAATINSYNQDGAITDELNTLVSTLNTTTADVSALVSSEGTIVEDAGDAIAGTLASVIQVLL